MITSFRTVIHGRTIELPWDLGLPEGHVVEVTIKTRPDVENPAEPPLDIPTVETWCDRIIFDPAISPTEKVVKGTSLLAEPLVAELQAGKSEENLLRAHRELTSEDVAAIRNYARWPVGLRQSFGAWADEAKELDEYLAWMRENRRLRRRGIEE
jgi:uncharacterized protein (DUF433 family)